MTDSLKTILCIGDSLTEGDYGSEPEGTANVHPEGYPYFLEKYLGVTAINAGKCGFTSLDYWKYPLKTLDLSTASASASCWAPTAASQIPSKRTPPHPPMKTMPILALAATAPSSNIWIDQNPDMPIFLCTCPYVDPSRRLRHANCVADRQRCYPEDCSEIPSSPAVCKSGAWRQRLQHQNHAACGWPSRQLPFLQQTWNLHWKSRSLPL